MIKNLESLLPTASTEDVYFWLGMYHGEINILNRIAEADKYFNTSQLRMIVGVKDDEKAEAGEDF